MEGESESDVCDSFKPNPEKIQPKDIQKKERDDFQNELNQIKIMHTQMEVSDLSLLDLDLKKPVKVRKLDLNDFGNVEELQGHGQP